MTNLNSENIRWAILIATLGMLIMVIFVIAFVIYYQKKQIQQQKKLRDVEKEHQRILLETALNSEEAERRRIAQDLHDDIGTMLSLTKLSINQLSKAITKDNAHSSPDLQKARSLLDDTIVQVRRITRDLVPTTLEHFGLAAAIEEFINRLENSSSLTVQFYCDADRVPRLTPKVELALYRITQELVNNAVKHSQCSTIDILLNATINRLDLHVIDDGTGFDATTMRESSQAGLGLRNIESRLSVINGKIAYPPIAKKGFQAQISVPIETLPAEKVPLPSAQSL